MESKPNSLAALLSKAKQSQTVQQTAVVEEKKNVPPVQGTSNPFATLAKTVAANKDGTAQSIPQANATTSTANCGRSGFRIGGTQSVKPAGVEQSSTNCVPKPSTTADITLDNIGDLQIEVDAPAAGPIKYVHDGQPTELGQKAIEELRLLIKELEDSFAGFDIQNALRRVLNHMKGKAFLKDFLLPEDVAIMVRGLRQSYGMVVTTKTDNKAKRAKKKASDDDILGDLAGIDIQL